MIDVSLAQAGYTLCSTHHSRDCIVADFRVLRLATLMNAYYLVTWMPLPVRVHRMHSPRAFLNPFLTGVSCSEHNPAIFRGVQSPIRRAVSTISSESTSCALIPSHGLCFCSVIGILVSHFLIGIQEVASARAHPSAESLPLVASDGPAEPETIGLLQFVRADVDEWIQSESTHPALEACSALPQGDGPGTQGDEGNIEVSDPVQTV